MIAEDPKRRTLSEILEKSFSLDLRSLALFRVGLAALVLADLLQRSRNLTAFYTAQGVSPLPPFSERSTLPFPLWPHLWNDSAVFQTGLFILSGLVALAMMAGFRTRWAVFLMWLSTVSLHNRSPVILYGADQMIGTLLFWSMFLPLGARFSIDGLIRPASKDRHRIFSAATAALCLQTVMLYSSATLSKLATPEWAAGSALHHALIRKIHVTTLAEKLLAVGDPWLAVLNYTVLVIQAAGPIVLFFPSSTPRLRILTILVFCLMHAGFGVFFNLGLFPWAGCAAMLAFLPPVVWKARVSTDSFRDPGLFGRVSSMTVALCLGIAVLLWISALPGFAYPPLRPLYQIGSRLHIRQEWGMFSGPRLVDNKILRISGELETGGWVTLIDQDKTPPWIHVFLRLSHFDDIRWRNYFVRLIRKMERAKGDAVDPGGFSRYVCGLWNKNHGRKENFSRIRFEVFKIPYGGAQHRILDIRTACNPSDTLARGE